MSSHHVNQHLIFLPGTLCNQTVFASQIAYLSEHGYSCTVVDYGMSDNLESMAQSTLDAMPEQACTLIAFSMGGMVAFEVLRQQADRVDKLVLIGSNAHADGEGKAALRQEHLHQARAQGLQRLIINTYMPNYLYDQAPDLQTSIIEMATSLGIDVYAAQLEVLAKRPDSSELLQMLDKPVLIISGENDVLCPPSEQSRMHDLCKHSALIHLPHCGHFATLEHPEAVNDSLLRWLS